MIVPTLARLIVREHIYSPIRGSVLALGRQTIAMTYEQTVSLFRQEGFSPSQDALRQLGVSHDQKTRERKSEYISDELFWGMLGVTNLSNMDVSGYEGADIIHNLNDPIPESLQEQFDFLVDGGTFDHLVDIKVAFQNCARMLRPGGRILQWNAASNGVGAAYVSFGPNLFYDYYTLNQFSDCKAYVAQLDDWGQLKDWDFYLLERSHALGNIRSGCIQLVVILAEKGLASTWDLVPIQAGYRDQETWEPYTRGEMTIKKSRRRPWTGRGEVEQKEGPGILRQALSWLRTKTPGSVRARIPLSMKNAASRAATPKDTGFRYVGRI